MSDSIYLQGSETVHDAGCKISNASNDILRAANIIEDATNQLTQLFGQGYGSNLKRLIEALENLKNLKPQ